MNVTTGLIVRERWIDLILSGEKTWEMRSKPAPVGVWFGLIRKGSGAVCAIARLGSIGEPLVPEEMIASFEKHRIPETMIRSGEVAKWNIPWVLSGVRRLRSPVPYCHRSGAVTWVKLDPDVTGAISVQLDQAVPSTRPLVADDDPVTPEPASPSARRTKQSQSAVRYSAPLSRALSGMWGETEITQGNIDNNHFSLRPFIHHFPSDLIGGSNKLEAAAVAASIDWGGPVPVETDIDATRSSFAAGDGSGLSSRPPMPSRAIACASRRRRPTGTA